jgi:hypothetical protein
MAAVEVEKSGRGTSGSGKDGQGMIQPVFSRTRSQFIASSCAIEDSGVWRGSRVPWPAAAKGACTNSPRVMGNRFHLAYNHQVE